MKFNYEAPETVERPTDDSLIYTKSRVMIVKKLTFDAAHHLYDYDGKCRALHGHTYHVDLGISGFLDHRGMTLDFGDLKKIFKEHLEPLLDHRYLNESLPYMNTTAENMSAWIFETLGKHLPDERGLRVEFVKLYETPTAFAEVRREWMLES